MLNRNLFVKSGLSLITVSLIAACGGGSSGGQTDTDINPPPVNDSTPDPFEFTSVTDVPISTDVLSSKITINGINVSSDISIINGLFSINGATFTATKGKVNKGDVVQIKHQASADFLASTESIVTIGGVSASFKSTTFAGDISPSSFNMPLKREVPLGTWVSSDPYTVSGISSRATASVTLGELSVNGGDFSVSDQVVHNGDTISVRHKTPLQLNSVTTSLVTIGDLKETFASITQEVMRESGQPAVQLNFPNKESGSSLTEITYQGTVTSDKQINNILVNDVNATITRNHENKLTWSATVPLSSNADTLVSITVEDENSTTTDNSRVSNSKLTPHIIYDESKDRIFGFLPDQTVIELDLDNGVSKFLRNNSSFDLLKPTTYREESESFIVLDMNYLSNEVRIISEPIANNDSTVLYQESHENITFAQSRVKPALSVQQDKMYYAMDDDSEGKEIIEIKEYNFATNEVTTLYTVVQEYGTHVLSGLIADEQNLYILDKYELKERLVKVNLETGEAQQYPNPFFNENAYWLSSKPSLDIADNKLYINSPSNLNTVIFDLTTGSYEKIDYEEKGVKVGLNIGGSFFDHKRNRLVFGDREANAIFSADADSGFVSTLIRSGIGQGSAIFAPLFIALPDDTKGYVLHGDPIGGNASLTVVELETGNRKKLLNFDYSDQLFNETKSFDLSGSNSLLILTATQLIEVSLVDYSVSKRLFSHNLNYGASFYDSSQNAYYILNQEGDAIVKMDKNTLEIDTLYELPTAVSNVTGLSYDALNKTFYFSSTIDLSLLSIDTTTGDISHFQSCPLLGHIGTFSDDTMYQNPNVSSEFGKVVTSGLNALNVFDIASKACSTIELYSPESMMNRDAFYVPIDAKFDTQDSIIGTLPLEIFKHNYETKQTVSIAGGVNGITKADDNDDRPDSFIFADVNDTELSAYVYSNSIKVTGISSEVPISVIDGEYSINGDIYINESSTVSSGDRIIIRHTSSDQYQTQTTSLLNVGSFSALFKSHTKAEELSIDNVPDPIEFPTIQDVARFVEVESETATVTGINVEVPLSIINGQYSLNGAAYTNEATTVKQGDTIQLKHTSSDASEAATHTWLYLADTAISFTSKTKSLDDESPDILSFDSRFDVELLTPVTSNEVTMSDIEGQVTIYTGNAEHSINGGEFKKGESLISNGDTLRIRHISSDEYSTIVDSLFSVGDNYYIFSSTTRARDTEPDIISFIPQENVELSTTITSNEVSISGVEGHIDIQIVQGEYSLNGAEFTAEASTATNGDTLVIRHTSADSYATSIDSHVFIGSINFLFRSVTKSN